MKNMNSTPVDFDKIYKEYHASVLGYLTKMVGSSEAADVTQEVFSKVDKGLQRFDGRSALATWIFRIATNSAHDWWRNSRKKRLEIHLADGAASVTSGCLFPQAPEKHSPLELVITTEMNVCIREQIDKLPDIYRTVLILNSLQEFNNKEIAEILGVSLSTVKMRLHRGRTMLKKILEGECRFYTNPSSGALACDRKIIPPTK